MVCAVSEFGHLDWAVNNAGASARNVRVNAIAPGGTNTEMLASGTQQQRDFLASLSPMKRVSEPAEIAAGIVYLLADTTFSTAVTLSGDGGQSAA